MVFERFKVLINTDVSSIEPLKESLDSSLSLSYFPSPWRLFCSRLVETHFHPSGCLLFLNHFNQLKNVGMWLSHHFLQSRMPPFNMGVGAWAVKVKIVPLFELDLSIDPCAVEVLDKAVDLWDLWSLLLYCQPSWTNK